MEVLWEGVRKGNRRYRGESSKKGEGEEGYRGYRGELSKRWVGEKGASQITRRLRRTKWERTRSENEVCVMVCVCV